MSNAPVIQRRIGLVGPVPPPHGGMANQLQQLRRLLTAEGIAVTLVPVNPPYHPAWVGRLRGLRAAARLWPYLCSLYRVAGRVDLLHVFANSGWSWHLFAAPAIWVARLRGTPVIVNYRGGEAAEFLDAASRWVLPTLRRADLLVVPSGFLAEVFGRWGVGSDIVPNIIDLERFAHGVAVAERDLSAPHLVVTRNLESIYDVATALRAFGRIRQRLPHARLTVAGEGPERGALEALAAELGIATAVNFAGRLSNDAVADLYRVADLMLNASRVDNMPISLLESLACSVPVVSTRAGGIPHIVDDGVTALLVDVGDDAAMAAAALRLLGDADAYRRMAQAGREAVGRYAWPQVRTEWLRRYDRVAGGSSSAAQQ